MRRIFRLPVGIAVLALALLPDTAGAGEASGPDHEREKVGYAVGYQVGGDFRRQGLAVDPEMLVRGVLDALAGSEPLMTAEEMRQSLVDVQREAEAARQRERQKLAAENLAAGRAYLAQNAEREGVETLPSGLQYRVIEPGTGPTPRPDDTVTVHYRGTLVDGSEFDSSYGRGEPATFGAADVIDGWKEALSLMREGARWELYVPPELAYGEAGSGLIGPNSTLIFDIELLSVTRPGSGG